MLVKSKSGLARSTASRILHHCNLLGFRTIWQARLAQQITSLIVRLNNTGIVGTFTWIRLRQAQLDSKCKECITMWSNSRIKGSKFRFNFNAKLIQEAKAFKINVECKDIEESLRLADETSKEYGHC